MKRNLILIGFMGTGKTSVAKYSAQSLGFSYVDTDQVIEQIAQKTIPEIFEEEGETHFRQLETQALQQVTQNENQVIATGGGIVTTPENTKLLTTGGYVIWLKATPEIIYDRVSHNSNRPLLQTENPQETIYQMMEDRHELYKNAAHISINTTDLTIDETVHGVTESARLALS